MSLNTRVLGALCLIGNAIWFVDSAAWVANHGDWNTIHQITWAVGAIAGICGVLGLIALKVVGPHPVIRSLLYLPILGFLFYLASSIANADTVSLTLAWFGQMATMLLVGLLVLVTKGWGWRKGTPLLTALAPLVGLMLLGPLGLPGTFPLTLSLAWALLGYAVWSTVPLTPAPAARVRD